MKTFSYLQYHICIVCSLHSYTPASRFTDKADLINVCTCALGLSLGMGSNGNSGAHKGHTQAWTLHSHERPMSSKQYSSTIYNSTPVPVTAVLQYQLLQYSSTSYCSTPVSVTAVLQYQLQQYSSTSVYCDITQHNPA